MPKDAKARQYIAAGNHVAAALHEWKRGKLRSGSSKGPRVRSRAQAIAIGLSEKRRAEDKRRASKRRSKQDTMILGKQVASSNSPVPTGEVPKLLEFSDPSRQLQRRYGGMGHDFDRM